MPLSGVLEGFLAHVQRRPDACALSWHRDEVTYAHLHRLAQRQLARLGSLGADPQQPVAVLAEKTPDGVALVLACLLGGRRFLLLSPTTPSEMQQRLAEQAGCALLVSPGTARRLHRGRPADGIAADGVSFMLTTSGSTGAPKIVPLPDAAVDRFTAWAHERFDVGPGRGVLSYAPLNFDVCLLDVWATLRYGGRVVLVDAVQATNPQHLLALIGSRRVHVIQAVPLFYRLIVDAAAPDDAPLAGVEHVIFTGDTLPRRYLGELPWLFPHARLYNVYGCTETNDSFIYQADPDRLPDGPAPLGDPLPGVTALLVGTDGTVLTGTGMGELLVHTPFQTDGYLGRPTADDRFVSAPGGRFAGYRFFRSGDLVRRHADGRLTLEGRTDHQVKIRGSRVNTQEVERVLLEHPEVVEAAVVTVPDAAVGRCLHAVLRRAPGSRLDSLRLRQHCATSLTPAAIPTTIRITDDPLPRTTTGKVDRNLISAGTSS